MNYENESLHNPEKKTNKKTDEIICLWCNQRASLIWVHGHGQCSNCGYNTNECCKGESCDNYFHHDNNTNSNDIYHE